jgi:hypothetical protein
MQERRVRVETLGKIQLRVNICEIPNRLHALGMPFGMPILGLVFDICNAPMATAIVLKTDRVGIE